MAKKFKLNKSELSRLKKEEKIYSQFLPVLKLKQEQLQMEQLRIKRKLHNIKIKIDKFLIDYESLIFLLSDIININITDIISINKIVIEKKSIAGVKVPSLIDIIFNNPDLHYFGLPAWIIRGFSRLQNFLYLNVEYKVISKQFTLISKDLKKASQKVNLFEKLLLPETKQAIKRIKIILGDEQVAAVGRGKIAKSKKLKYDIKFNS